MTVRLHLARQNIPDPRLVDSGADTTTQRTTKDLEPNAVALDQVQEMLEDGWRVVGAEVVA